jgi:ribonuclease D
MTSPRNDPSRVVWVRDREALLGVVRDLGRGPVALDTEADSFHRYRAKVCLVQLSGPAGTALLDPLSGLDLEPLRPLLEDPGIRKVLHGSDYDIRILDRDFGLRVRGLFDTMIAARLTGARAWGLATLLGRHLGVEIDKRFQLADWSRRPLPDGMIAYAAADTRHLVPLSELLEKELVRTGRVEWAQEEFRRLEAVRWAGAPEDSEAYRRLKGASRLDRLALAVLRELHAWRESEARRRDVPAFRVLPDALLVGIARQRSETGGETSRFSPMPRRLARRGEAEAIREAVRRALALPPDRRPELHVRSRPRVPPAVRRRVERLRKRRDAVARELDLEPALVAPRSLLEAVAGRIESGESWRDLPELRTWQTPLLARIVQDAS